MASDEATASSALDQLRVAIPVIALVIVALSVATYPSRWLLAMLLLVPVAAFAAWARRWVAVPVLTAAVVVPLLFVRPTGDLEPALFLLSVLALVITGFDRMGVSRWLCLAAAVATPPVVAWLSSADEFGWQIWIGGIALPASLGWSYHRQAVLAAQLESTRRQLTERALTDERRRIARDVHDLVGHGLAAMMVQVTSARHVLRDDPDAADEALDSAETVGRQSMSELRSTVALLRRDGETAVSEPPPGLQDVGRLVESSCAQGFDIRLETSGDPARVDDGTALTIYRIVQEAVANAGQHAPSARTTVRIAVEADEVELSVDSVGPVRAVDTGRQHFGVRGMQERAETAGGTLRADASATGWSVECRVPLPVSGRRGAQAEYPARPRNRAEPQADPSPGSQPEAQGGALT